MIVSAEFLQNLAAYRSEEGILSVYLRVDPKLMYERRHPLSEFKAALKHVDAPPEENRSRLHSEIDRVLHFLEEPWSPTGRGLVIFSCQPLGLWETVSLNVTVPNVVHFTETAQVRILARIIDENERYAAVVVDKEDAHLYIIHMGEIEQATEVFDEGVPGRHEQGGWSQARYRRHHEFHVHEHLKHVLERLQRYHQTRPFDRLILSGSEEALTEFEKMLPTPLQELVIGNFSVNRMDRPQEILDRARPVYEAFERRQEEALVDQIVNDSAAGGPGVLGAGDTIRALNEGRIRTLVVGDAVAFPGAECPSCGMLTEQPQPRCPACEAETDELPDIVERAVQRIYLNHGGVEVVFGKAAEKLAANGGIGAQLRF